jgi:hypothetical protein
VWPRAEVESFTGTVVGVIDIHKGLSEDSRDSGRNGRSDLKEGRGITRWDEKAGLLAGCDTLPMFDVLEAQRKGDRQ